MKKTLRLRLSFVPSLCLAQAPVISPIQGQNNICALPSQAFTFSVSATNNPTSFAWTVTPASGVQYNHSGASTSVSFPAGNGTYTLYAVAVNASGSSATTSFVVNVFETPTVTFSGAMITCQGSPTNIQASATTISASSTLSYSWTPSTGLNTSTGYNVIANPQVTTTYSLLLGLGPCTNTAQVTLAVIPAPVLSYSVLPSAICAGGFAGIALSGGSSYSINGVQSPPLTIVTPTQTTGYAVQTASNGCFAFGSFTVTVNPSPDLGSLAIPDALCSGNSSTFTPENATGTSYSVNGIPVQPYVILHPSQTTQYTVSAKNQYGCSQTTVHTIAVLPLPQVNASASRTIICKGESVTLAFSGAHDYELNGHPVQSPHTETLQATTVFTLTGTDAEQCSAVTTLSVLVSQCAGVRENQTELLIYPNPCDAVFWLEAEVQSTVILINQLGQVIKTINLVPEKPAKIEVLTPGIYFLSGEGIQKKIIVR